VIRLSVGFAGHLHGSISRVGREWANRSVDGDIGKVDTNSGDPAYETKFLHETK
jgi:hypothetical protein